MLIEKLLSKAVFDVEGAAGAEGGGSNGAAAPASLAALAGEIAGERGGEGGQGEGNDGPAPNGQQPAAEAPAGTPYFPEGLADDLRGTNDRETIDRLFERINSQPKAPEKAEDYKLELTPEQQSRFGDLEADPVHAIVREVALEAKLTNDQYQTVFTRVNDRLLEAGLLDTIDPMAELEKLMPKTGDEAERKTSAARRINDVAAQIRNAGTRAGLNEPQINTLLSTIDTADGVVAFESLLRQIGDRGVQPGGAPSQQPSREGLRAQMKDPRYDSLSPDYDAAFRRRVDEQFQQLGG